MANPSEVSSTDPSLDTSASGSQSGTSSGLSTSSTPSSSGTFDAEGGTEPLADGVDWRAYKWNDLPAEVKGSAISLGYTETLWESGAGVATDQYFWNELSGAQQRAATLLFGYTGKQ